MKQYFIFSILIIQILFSCSPNQKNENNESLAHVETIKDQHTRANIEEIRTTHLHLELDINFENKIIYGVARHQMSENNIDHAIFDIKGLEIIKTTVGEKEETAADFTISDDDELLGAALTVKIEPGTQFINIYYQTTENSEALDWLPAELTEGKVHPYLYTQGQAILTRSWIPLQDSPMNRITYSADITVPSELIAVMSADNPTEKNDEGKYHFMMKQKIPSYLIALAVGDLVYTSLGENCGIYSEKELEDACAYEFGDLPKMISAAEGLYGEYLWDQYDIVMLPYSFPFGGMENPRLTFANPTILAGDRSSTSVVAHELAHSWSGNLVTNATWDDFWLNEGFTVYFENRIMEEIYGKETADILATIEYQDLTASITDIGQSEFPEDTRLKLELNDRNPDEGMTDIAYVKGAFFLRTIEQSVGREKHDSFLSQYFQDHAFQSITTEIFVEDLKNKLLDPNAISFNIDEWIYQEGLPENHLKIKSQRLEKMVAIAEKSKTGKDIFSSDFKDAERNDFITQEWLTFFRTLSPETSIATMTQLDAQFKFSSDANAIVKSDWFKLSAQTHYREQSPEMQKYLIKIGRRWLIEGIYQILMDSDDAQDHHFARETFEKAKNGYHFVSRSTIEGIVKK
ncbi:MAG TPA: M1 family peptidase [Crocinitomicaceae bacterium]|nr:M1 family peptidase [Crocinitomicaceae bacterium]